MSGNYSLIFRVTGWLADRVERMSSRDSLVSRLSWWAYERERRRREALLRSLGWRIVTQDPIGAPEPDGSQPWHVLDTETRELLAVLPEGRNDYDALDAVWRDEWLHRDRVMDELFEELLSYPPTEWPAAANS